MVFRTQKTGFVVLLALLACSNPSSCSLVSANELAGELSVGAKVKQERPSWGKAVHGLQLGIRLDYLNRPYKMGEVAAFTLSVRNVGKAPIKLNYYQPDWSLSPKVVDARGKPLSLREQLGLAGPAYDIPVQPVRVVILPKQILDVTRAHLTIGPPRKEEANPNLDVTRGRYKISYNYAFYPDSREEKSDSVKSWVGRLSSGRIVLQVVK